MTTNRRRETKSSTSSQTPDPESLESFIANPLALSGSKKVDPERAKRFVDSSEDSDFA